MLDVPLSARVMAEEIFGPILPVVKVSGAEEVWFVYVICLCYMSYYNIDVTCGDCNVMEYRLYALCIHMTAHWHCTYSGKTEPLSTGKTVHYLHSLLCPFFHTMGDLIFTLLFTVAYPIVCKAAHWL